MMKRLVLKTDPGWESFVRTGWRCTFVDGEADIMWGLGLNDDESLASFLANVRYQYGDVEVIDLRGCQDGVPEIG